MSSWSDVWIISFVENLTFRQRLGGDLCRLILVFVIPYGDFIRSRRVTFVLTNITMRFGCKYVLREIDRHFNQ
jgi:hypothetical protein